ncbi:DUF6266 family protein [Sphingobacterium sp. SRCM116780]|uniref:DUF6266 family protein n=1 Tax=Sphingobacterium sp. SRCM116780 TaxID=2907623 RepID=UPI001F29D917|nr:DUF6266 family protein [Sphingobacterium sp. SRCM116780]UIR56157.1 DUF6266 family protein [Sphingobacterium sp. SRCM116780]
MARIKNGPNGSASGKAGSVVFCKWKEIEYIRGLPKINKNRLLTIGQKKNQSKFKFVQDRLRIITSVVHIGFMHAHPNRTGFNSAMSYNLLEGAEETETGYALIWEKFAISSGLPFPVHTYTIVQDTAETISVNWELDESLVKKLDYSSFRCTLLFYPADFEKGEVFGCISDQPLSDKKQTVQLTTRNKRGGYHIYMAFFASNGSNKTTDSRYLGTINW